MTGTAPVPERPHPTAALPAERDGAPVPWLVLDASTVRATVAVVAAGSVIAHEAVAMRGAREERLMPAAAAALSAAGLRVPDLGRVVCGAGPGSFTSLRIAAALGKGFVTGAPSGPRLAAVSSLLLMVGAAADRLPPGLYAPTLDALRGERYVALVALEGPEMNAGASHLVRPSCGGTQARAALRRGWERILASDLSGWAAAQGATVLGPDCGVEAWPDAAGAIATSAGIVDVDPIGWQPDYGRLAEAEARRAAAAAREAP